MPLDVAMPNGLVARAKLSKWELVTGAVLLGLAVVHYGWCAWSLPRYGVITSHGLETAACNWGTKLLGVMLGGLGVATAVSGSLGYALRSRAVAWWVSQLPAAAAWGALLLSIVSPVLSRL